LIEKDFGAESWLFFVATQGALIEKHESALAEEQKKKYERKQQLEQAEQKLARAEKELKDLKNKSARNDQTIRDIKVDLANMKWAESDGKPDSMEWEMDMEADSDGETVMFESDEEAAR
jgi:uncharacterized protein HemX